MKKMKKLLALSLCFCMVFALAACGGGDDKDSGEAKEINVCLASEPNSIDPALNSAVDGATMIIHAFEGLTKWENDGKGQAKLAPGVAESWDISEDGLTYTFHLRDDATWSDGEPVTSKDFEYAWRRLADPATAADYCNMLDPIKGYDSVGGETDPQIEAPDDYTFVVTLDVPLEAFLEICAFPALMPVRQDTIEANGDQWTFDPETYVCNGPYKMAEWEHNSYIRFEKRDDYYAADEIVPPSIKFHLMDDANAMLSGIRSGDLDLINNFPPEEVPSLIESGDLKVEPQLGTYYVCFNTERAPFDDPKVREAFSLTIDRPYICDQIVADGSEPAGGFVATGLYDAEGKGSDFRETGGDYYDPSADAYKANCDKARELLAEAGYPNGEGFPVVEYLYNTDDRHKAIGEGLQDMWQKELGVQVSMVNQDWSVFLDERKAGNFSVARNGWVADYNDPMTFLDMWTTDNGNNDAQYSSAEYDQLITDAKNAVNVEDKMKIMHQAEDLLMGQDKVLAPVFYYKTTYMVGNGLKDYFTTPLGYYFFYNATKD